MIHHFFRGKGGWCTESTNVGRRGASRRSYSRSGRCSSFLRLAMRSSEASLIGRWREVCP